MPFERAEALAQQENRNFKVKGRNRLSVYNPGRNFPMPSSRALNLLIGLALHSSTLLT
jgi:hypothetical protein